MYVIYIIIHDIVACSELQLWIRSNPDPAITITKKIQTVGSRSLVHFKQLIL